MNNTNQYSIIYTQERVRNPVSFPVAIPRGAWGAFLPQSEGEKIAKNQHFLAIFLIFAPLPKPRFAPSMPPSQ